MENIKWKRIIRAIKNEGTILFIGPNVEKNENGEVAFHAFCTKIQEEYKGDIGMDKDGFFFFIDPEAQSDVVYDMKEFYEKNDFGIDIYQKIAAIPFHLIITLSPDDALHNVFNDNGVPHQFAYFDFYKEEPEQPTAEKPLIYNLFGLATQGKYILTQEDYFDYLKAILGDDVLPQKIVSQLKDATNYIFLGFDFDKWYNRLLLMILNFHDNKESKTSHAINSEGSNELLEQLVQKQFNITLIENNEADFVQTFYSEIEKAGMLRELISKEEALKKQIKEKQQLLNEYEEKVDLGNDPKEKLRCEKEIEKLEKEIAALTQTLKTL